MGPGPNDRCAGGPVGLAEHWSNTAARFGSALCRAVLLSRWEGPPLRTTQFGSLYSPASILACEGGAPSPVGTHSSFQEERPCGLCGVSEPRGCLQGAPSSGKARGHRTETRGDERAVVGPDGDLGCCTRAGPAADWRNAFQGALWHPAMCIVCWCVIMFIGISAAQAHSAKALRRAKQ